MTEHVYLESEDIEVPELRAGLKLQAALRLRSAIRGGSLTLAIFDNYYLAVASKPHRSVLTKYVLDLRFVDPSPQRMRRVEWRLIQVTLGLVVLSAAAAWWLRSSPVPWWQHGWLPAVVLLFAVTLCAALLSAYRTTETLVWSSTHGRVELVRFTGGLGTFHACRAFQGKLAAHIRAAIAARAHPRERYLRDEMREHHRLRELGVLSAEEYETSKARILRGHDAGTTARDSRRS